MCWLSGLGYTYSICSTMRGNRHAGETVVALVIALLVFVANSESFVTKQY